MIETITDDARPIMMTCLQLESCSVIDNLPLQSSVWNSSNSITHNQQTSAHGNVLSQVRTDQIVSVEVQKRLNFLVTSHRIPLIAHLITVYKEVDKDSLK